MLLIGCFVFHGFQLPTPLDSLPVGYEPGLLLQCVGGHGGQTCRGFLLND